MMNLLPVIIAVLANGFVATTGQYVDILQGLQAFLQPFQFTTEQTRYYDITTRRPETRRHGDRRTGEVTRPYNPINNYNIFTTTIKPSRKSTRINSSQYQTTTRKPNKRTEATRLPWESDNYNNQTPNYNTDRNVNRNNNNNYSGTNTEYNNKKPSKYNNNGVTTTENYNKHYNYANNKPNDRRPPVVNNNDDTVINNLGKIDEPNRGVSNRNVNVSGFTTPPPTRTTKNNRVATKVSVKPNYNTFTTKSPYLTRPGVKPAPVDENQPPITNKPGVTQPAYVGNPRPFEGADVTPTIEIGPDEDDMTPAEKSRYIELAESMCDSYKALSVKEVVALPLVPSPQGVAVNVSACTPLNIALIIGGKVSTIEEFPHMALVGWKKIQQNSYSWKCGGSLISDQYILTAGHCTYHEKDYNVVDGPPHAVQLGSSLVDNPDAVIVKVASVIRHPKYKQRRSYFDVALIRMAKRVTFSDVIRPACLGVPPPIGKPVIATGWGRTELGGDQSNELRSVSLPIWEMQDCRRIWGTSLKLPNGPTVESHVCAGERDGGKDTCQGDSGGPAQIQEGCTWRVVAVTSYGRSCGAPRTPALYAVIPRAFVAAEVFGKLTGANNQNKQNGNAHSNYVYESQSQSSTQLQNNYGYESQQQNDNRFESQQQNDNRFESQQHNDNRFESQQHNDNRFESQQQNDNRYESQQQNNNKYDYQQENNGYVNQQKKKNQYENLQSPNNGYTSSRYTSNLYGNQQSNNGYLGQQQSNVNKFESQQQTTNRYNNNQQEQQQQNDNKYNNNKQQGGNVYDKNKYIYQQLYRGDQQQTGEWNKQNRNRGDAIPVGDWTMTDERDENYHGGNSWSHQRQNDEDTNYFATTAIPWWAS